MYTPNLDLITSKTVTNHNISDKRVLLRTCLNVSTDENGNIIDDTRLTESLQCISYLAENCKQLVIMAHLGRPKSPSPSTSFAQLVKELEKRLGKPVHFVIDLEQSTIDSVKTGEHQIIMIENIRYFEGEDSKDAAEQQKLIDKLMQIADVFVNDAFADYRESVSSYYIAKHLPSYVGALFAQEVSKLAYLTQSPKPFVVLMGGSKLSEKLDALLGLLPLADHVLIGGAMAYTLMQAKGLSIGKSLVESDKIDVAQKIMSQYAGKIHLPIDHAIVSTFADPGETVGYADSIPDGEIAVDVGPKTVSDYQEIIAQAGTIARNGPMGVCERTATSVGTNKLGHAIMSNTNAYKVAGGGDSITAIYQLGLSGFDHISTGGGAMLAIFGDDGFPTLDVIISSQ